MTTRAPSLASFCHFLSLPTSIFLSAVLSSRRARSPSSSASVASVFIHRRLLALFPPTHRLCLAISDYDADLLALRPYGRGRL